MILQLQDACSREMRNHFGVDSAKGRSKSHPGDDRRFVVRVARNSPVKKKDGDHTQPSEVFGNRHGCRRGTDDMGDRAERDREPSARRLGLKLTESALLFWCPAGLPAPHRGEGS